MAKGQQRSGKEPRKQKSGEKKPKVPKYLRSTELVQTGKLGAQRPGQKT